MKKKIELGTALFFIIVGCVLSMILTYFYLANKMPSVIAKGKIYDKIDEVFKVVDSRYVGEYDSTVAQDKLLAGYIAGVDKYSVYMTKAEYQEHRKQTEGKYSGIGLSVKYDPLSGLIRVANIKPNSPAMEQGIQKGDLIMTINDNAVAEMSYANAVAKMKGELGSTVNLVLLRSDKQVTVAVTVKEYQSSSIEKKMLESNIGYVSISDFDSTTFDDFKKAVEDLKGEGAVSFVFDVRNNTGGLLSSVVNILDYILPEGIIATVRDNKGAEEKFESAAESVLDMPMAVLINGSTYSGGELFAAAIRDFNVGKLVGETTYGKGYAQDLIPLNDGSAIYLSTMTYYPPNGENYEGKGVAPDVSVKLTHEQEDRFYELTPQEDTQLQKALEQLK